MEKLIMAGQLLLGLGMLVFIHELGHFLAARAFGIKVEKFFVFFDFGGYKLFSKKIGGTEYGVGWFPLGGYVKIAGMIDESMDKEQLGKEPEPWEFRSKPVWQRFIVMFGGIFMNIVLGIIIFTFWLMYYQVEYLPPQNASQDGIYAYQLGREVGLETGDNIIAINGNEPKRARELYSLKVFFGANLTVERDGDTVDVKVPGEFYQLLRSNKSSFIGFTNYPFYIDSVMQDLGAAEAGIQAGDRIIRYDSVPISKYGDFTACIMHDTTDEVVLKVLRDNDTLTKTVPLTFSKETKTKVIGVTIGKDDEHQYETERYTLGKALVFGTKEGFETIYYNAVGLGKVITGKEDPVEAIQSPVAIAGMYGGEWKWSRFWSLTGLISFILAFMNFLPIPALDGGHIMFLAIEAVKGSPVSEKTMERAQIVGMVFLLLLMAFAIGKDIFL